MTSPSPPATASHRRRRTPNPTRLSSLRPRLRRPVDRTDRLSALPDGILHRIFALLPLDAAVRTAALSSRYRHVWSSNPSLSFPSSVDLDRPINREDYISAVDSCLRLCSSTDHFTSLSFTIDQSGSYSDRREIASRWAEFAALRLVDSLSFTFKYPIDDLDEYNEDEFQWLVALPESFFCCWSIQTLNLDHCTIPLIPESLGRPIFPFLESVFLRSVAFTEDSFADFLSVCPKIKKLNIAGTKFSDPIVISSASLEVLDVYNNVFRVESPVSIKSAPVLRVLGLCCDLTRVDFVNLGELKEAVLLSGTLKKFKKRSEWRILVSCLRNVEALVVDDWFTEFTLNGDIDFETRPPIFRNLTKLDFCGNPAGCNWVKGLLYNISECPILEELYIRLKCRWSRQNNSIFDDFIIDDESGSSDDEMNEHEQNYKANIEDEKSCANILSEILKNVHFIPPIKKITMEIFYEEPVITTLIEFFLRKAIVLEKVIIYHHEDCDENCPEIITKLRHVKPVSSNVEILIRDESNFNERKTRQDTDWNSRFYDY